MQNLGDYLKDKKITFKAPPTLFEPDFRIATKLIRCPYCLNKLYLTRDKKMYFCKSKKHKARFVMSVKSVHGSTKPLNE